MLQHQPYLGHWCKWMKQPSNFFSLFACFDQTNSICLVTLQIYSIARQESQCKLFRPCICWRDCKVFTIYLSSRVISYYYLLVSICGINLNFTWVFVIHYRSYLLLSFSYNRQIVQAEGPSGPNREYLFVLENALLQIGKDL
jgi:hypothetical protein